MCSEKIIREPLVQVKNLKKLYPLAGGLFKKTDAFIHAVDGVNFTIPDTQSLALVGESGSGKTTAGKLLVRLIDPTDGSIQMRINGFERDIANLERVRTEGLSATRANDLPGSL